MACRYNPCLSRSDKDGGWSHDIRAGQLSAALLIVYLLKYSVIVDSIGIVAIAAGAAQRSEGTHRGCKFSG